MATTIKVIVQLHERTSQTLIDADLQLRELGFMSDINTFRFNENDGTKHNIWMQDSSAPIFDNTVTFSSNPLILKGSPVFVIKNSTGAGEPGYISIQNAAGTEQGYMGLGDGTNFVIQNSIASANTVIRAGSGGLVSFARGDLSLSAGVDIIGSSTSDITINTNKFTVAGATGNTHVAGVLSVLATGSNPGGEISHDGTDFKVKSIFTGGMFLDTSSGNIIVRPGGVTAITATSINVTAALPFFTVATAAGSSGFRLPHGTVPTSPTNGDMWTTTAGLYVRINGSTVGPLT